MVGTAPESPWVQSGRGPEDKALQAPPTQGRLALPGQLWASNAPRVLILHYGVQAGHVSPKSGRGRDSWRAPAM